MKAITFIAGALLLIRSIGASIGAEQLADVSWDALAHISQPDGQPAPKIQFDPAAQQLNGRRVHLVGYMTPFNLGDGKTITSFLMTGTPGTCPFCLGAGPEDFVIVTASVPIPIDITAELALDGRFKVAADDPTGFYYRLDDAVPVSGDRTTH